MYNCFQVKLCELISDDRQPFNAPVANKLIDTHCLCLHANYDYVNTTNAHN